MIITAVTSADREEKALSTRQLWSSQTQFYVTCDEEGFVPTFLQVGPDLNGVEEGDEFASSMALSSDGKTLIVGAYKGGNPNSGKAYVYAFDSSTSQWISTADFTGVNESDLFGYSVAISKDGLTIAIGSIYSNDIGTKSGNVRFYRRGTSSSQAWNDLGVKIVGQPYDRSGIAIALSEDGDIAAIASERGNIRVFEWNTSWNQIGTDESIPIIGTSVAVTSNGPAVAIGQEDVGTGSMKIYSWYGGNWNLGATFDGKDSCSYCGHDVAFSELGESVAMTCTGGDGCTQVFEITGDGWSQIGQSIKGTGYGQIDLADDGSVIAIGSKYHDGDVDGSSIGRASVYRRDVYDNWAKVGLDIEGKEEDELHGYSVAISGDASTVLVGSSPFDFSPYPKDVGIVRTYALGCGDADASIPTDSPSVKDPSNTNWNAIIVAVSASVGSIAFIITGWYLFKGLNTMHSSPTGQPHSYPSGSTGHTGQHHVTWASSNQPSTSTAPSSFHRSPFRSNAGAGTSTWGGSTFETSGYDNDNTYSGGGGFSSGFSSGGRGGGGFSSSGGGGGGGDD